ncbi:MAG TPA: VOC family protein [Bryobacteraceae bacterium]|nr:VOC family protein [Bryobacteraceae bacterium]
MDLRIEVLVLPVSDVDRAKQFYESLGFHVDVDYASGDYRVLQLTPPGSEMSIIFGKGVTSAKPGSMDRLVMAVSNIEATRADLRSQGIEVGEVFHDAGGGLGAGFHTGSDGRAPGIDPEHRSYASYATFSDPDGNVWMLQEINERLAGRTSRELLEGEMNSVILEALKNASAAHGVHEKEIGKPDPDWPQWYAGHMTRALLSAGHHLSRASGLGSQASA